MFARLRAARLCRGEGWLLRGLALIEAAGGLTEAAALLVLLIARMLRLRRLALPSTKAVPGAALFSRVLENTKTSSFLLSSNQQSSMHGKVASNAWVFRHALCNSNTEVRYKSQIEVMSES